MYNLPTGASRLTVGDNTAAGELTEGLELAAEPVLVNVPGQVTNEQVGGSTLGGGLGLGLLGGSDGLLLSLALLGGDSSLFAVLGLRVGGVGAGLAVARVLLGILLGRLLILRLGVRGVRVGRLSLGGSLLRGLSLGLGLRGVGRVGRLSLLLDLLGGGLLVLRLRLGAGGVILHLLIRVGLGGRLLLLGDLLLDLLGILLGGGLLILRLGAGRLLGLGLRLSLRAGGSGLLLLVLLGGLVLGGDLLGNVLGDTSVLGLGGDLLGLLIDLGGNLSLRHCVCCSEERMLAMCNK